MKKPTKYTLVRKIELGSQQQRDDKVHKGGTPRKGLLSKSRATGRGNKQKATLAEQAIMNSVNVLPGLAKTFVELNPKFKTALVNSFVTIAEKVGKSGGKTKSKVYLNQDIISVTRKLAQPDKTHRVGILDMGAWIGDLPILLEKLNAVQPLFTIFEVQAPVPGGLLKSPLGMSQWLAEQSNEAPKKKRYSFERHVIANEFFAAAEDIRLNLGLDYIVGMTPAMVAGVEPNGEIYWNHFNSSLDKTILISTADIRLFTKQAGRPYEAGIGVLLVAALMSAVNGKLDYHKDTGCIFDENVIRANFVSTLELMRIDAKCIKKMTRKQIDATTNMLTVLKRMKRRTA